MTELIDPLKDVDGLTPTRGPLVQGRPGMVPARRRRMELLARDGRRAARAPMRSSLGRSQLVGKPLVPLLLAQTRRSRMCHSRTRDLAERLQPRGRAGRGGRRAAAGHADNVKPGAIVIDVGINRTDDGIVGDVDFDAVQPIAGAITPVRAGSGR